jgi:hypothetical protein
MTSIRGQIVKGTGTACSNLRTQLPKIADAFPEIRAAYPGTINLELEQGLIVVGADHRTPPISWNEQHHAGGEIFDLVRLRFFVPESAGTPVKGWLYVPHGSPHRMNPKIHEVIAISKRDLHLGMRCKIEIDRDVVMLPYKEAPLMLLL